MLSRIGTSQGFGFPISPSHPGLVAAGGGAPDWLPAGAAIFADFVNGHYYDSAVGVVTDPSDLFQSDDDDGDPWLPENITPGTGYVVPPAAVEVALSFKASPRILAGGATFVFEVDDAFETSMHLIAYDAPNFNTFWQAIMLNTRRSEVSISGDFFATDFNPSDPSGITKMAVNFSSAGLSASFGGSAVVRDPDSSQFAIINRVTASLNGEGHAIRTVAAYPIKPDSELPALCA